jgi:hypothetical protein
MAKLNDLIKRATRPEPDQMGFGASARKSLPSILLVALVGDHWSRAVSDAIAAGANAIVLQGKPGDRDIADAVTAAGESPVGVTLNDSPMDVLPKLREAKVDFVLVGPNAPAAALIEEDLAIVLQLHEELSDVQLRSLEPWSLDAIFLDREAASATIMKVLELQRVGGLARKPLLVPLPVDSTKDDLMALRDAGVAMLAVDTRERGALDSLKKYRETIDALPRKRARKEDKREAFLPTSGAGATHEHDEEEDDE